MKKRTLFGLALVAALLACSFILAPAAFAGNSTHTITIVNNSNTALKPDNTQHLVIYNSDSSCPAVPPDACGQVTLSPPSTIAAGSKGVINMTGPTGCNISAWQTYWTLDKKGKNGLIQCFKSPVNVCNSVSKNYTCTISQTNVDAVNGNGKEKVQGTVQ